MSQFNNEQEYQVVVAQGRCPEPGECLQVVIRNQELAERIIICGKNGFRGYPDPDFAYILHKYETNGTKFTLIAGQKNKKNTCCVFLIKNQ